MYHKGVQKFGSEKAKAAVMKEMDQLRRRNCFCPVDVSTLTEEEKRKAQAMLMLLSEKSNGKIKGRGVYNGTPTREWFTKEDAASPTVSMESIFLCATVDAHEEHDVMTNDIPNAFIQAQLPRWKDGEECILLKITGVLIDFLLELAPEVYGPSVVFEDGKRVLYLQVLRGLYGMLTSALLWYRKFRSDLEGEGYEFNPYDPCVCNKMIDGKQHTVRFHVDDCKSSHVDPKVNDMFYDWLNRLYGHHGEVTVTRGPIHEYLGMTFDFYEKGIVKVDMIPYMNAMVDDFSEQIKDAAKTPAADDVFAEGTGATLPKEKKEEFHTFMAKGIFACKRCRPDIHTATTALCTRVSKPIESDWDKLVRLLKYINGTRNDKLILSADDLSIIKWHVDASFAVHLDFKSHTGAVMSYGRGMPISMSRKQKLNTHSSTEAELVGPDDAMTLILWTKYFMEAQGYAISRNELGQDNKSAILLENNGKRSSSERTRAINICYFFITDQIEKGNIVVEYYPTGDMVADFMSKPLQGKLFEKFKCRIMGYKSFIPAQQDDRSVLDG